MDWMDMIEARESALALFTVSRTSLEAVPLQIKRPTLAT